MKRAPQFIAALVALGASITFAHAGDGPTTSGRISYGSRGNDTLELRGEGTQVEGFTFAWNAETGVARWTTAVAEEGRAAIAEITSPLNQNQLTLLCGAAAQHCLSYNIQYVHPVHREMVYADKYGTWLARAGTEVAPRSMFRGREEISWLPRFHPRPNSLRQVDKEPRQRATQLVNRQEPIYQTQRTWHYDARSQYGVVAVTNGYQVGYAVVAQTTYTPRYTDRQVHVATRHWQERVLAPLPDLGQIWIQS